MPQSNTWGIYLSWGVALPITKGFLVGVNCMKRIVLFSLACILFAALAWSRGIDRIERAVTDETSERQALHDANKIAAGDHKLGIVQYTHFPNGPSYILLLPIKMGIKDPRELRVVPVAFSVACLTLLILGLLLHLSNPVVAIVAVSIVTSLLWQPGVLNWMGALHEHAYVLALCFAGLGVALIPGVPRWALFGLAFLTGWMGYDLILGFIFSVLVGRWLVIIRSEDKSRKVAVRFFIDAATTVAGVAAAIASHIAQNAFYFGGIKEAIKDLIGSAAVRAGLEVGRDLTPGYFNNIRYAMQGKTYPRWNLIVDLIKAFLNPEWSRVDLMSYGLQASVGILVVAVVWKLFRKALSLKDLRIFGGAVVVVTIISVVSGTLWIIVMPDHARFHFHFLPRHFFVPITLFTLGLCSIADSVFRAKAQR